MNYLDCYAGGGAYLENDNVYCGSPILAAEIVEKHREHLGRKGCSIMKSAFAKFNYGNIEFSGPRHGNLSFFELKDIKTNEVKSFFLQKYKDLKKKYEEILIENIDSAPFLESDIKDAVKDMEGKEIKIKRIPELTRTGRKRRGIGLNDVISF